MNSTNHITDNLVALLTGDISPEHRLDAERHLGSCQMCQNEYKALTSLWNSLGKIPEETPSESLRFRFNRLLRNMQEERKNRDSAISLHGLSWRLTSFLK